MPARQGLSDHVALRIGMAAKGLPGVALEEWLAIIIRAVGLPITSQRLGKLRLSRLRQSGRRHLAAFTDEELRQAIAVLRGQGVDMCASLPDIEPYCQADMPGSVRVACASNRSDRIDAPFGTCARFLVYQVSAQEIRLIDIREIADLQQAEDKHAARAALINDCHVLYVLTIGGPATAKVVKAGLHPIKLGGPKRARDELQELQQVLDSSPPPWLLKIMEDSARQIWVIQQERVS